MKWLARASVVVFLLQLLVLLQIVTVEGHVKAKRVSLNATSDGVSPWLRNVANPRVRLIGCIFRPWTCEQGPHPPTARMRCCGNRCVDVSSDDAHCGLCAHRCPFTWRCCRGICIDTNINPRHCGSCDNECPWRVPCVYGMCGYAWPPPQPFPPHPPHPFPPHPPQPFPPHPPHPFPPHPPHPFPPHPPHPFPPHPPHPFPPHPPNPGHPQPEPCTPPQPRPPAQATSTARNFPSRFTSAPSR
ncbi:hypothetical protein V6N13_049589 [Hibiscus sabdariffa]|uniref:Stigma-specific Stig1 family protein n=1 Tax=Hibiscus sabdariffa TaxID=183260 RepID=A0ABR2QWV2_9ROSI